METFLKEELVLSKSGRMAEVLIFMLFFPLSYSSDNPPGQ